VPRYLVTARQRIFYTCKFEIEADSEAAAKQEAQIKYQDGDLVFRVDTEGVSNPDYEIELMKEEEPAQ